MRDQRLRHHYKERYDYRNNLIDYDYTCHVKEVSPSLHAREYREWRQKGNGFEIRQATYVKANRTMGCYVQGSRSNLASLSQKGQATLAS